MVKNDSICLFFLQPNKASNSLTFFGIIFGFQKGVDCAIFHDFYDFI